MNVLFLSDREDPILHSAYKYFSSVFDCAYGSELNNDAFVIVSNHYVPTDKKFIFYATDPAEDFTDRVRRRLAINWLQKCEVVCCSLYLAKNFLDFYRIRPSVQYPFASEQNADPIGIAYSNNFVGIDEIKKEIDEDFFEVKKPEDVAKAKVYLASPPGYFDVGLCHATANGVPVVAYNHKHLQEFLEPQDVVIGYDISITHKISVIKKILKEHGKMKSRSNKYAGLNTLEDKIKQALARKPSAVGGIMAQQPQQKKVIGKRNKVTTRNQPNHVRIPPLSESSIYVTGSVVNISGYDNFVYEVIKGLRSVGADIRINSLCTTNTAFCPSWFQDIRMVKPNDAWDIMIMPPCNLDRWAPSKKTIVYTMWETDHLEPFWVKQLNGAAFVIVPSQWAVECFKKSGVTVPIYKIPLGYDPLIFYPNSSWPEVCTFGTAAALTAGGIRKNTHQIIELFQKAFPNVKDVKLKVKVTPSCPLQNSLDKRVEIERNMLPPPSLANWYRSTTCFVNGSCAEGFGLHLIESMACGRPIISTEYSAVTEYFDDTVGWPTKHKIVPAKGGAYHGHWGPPVDEDIIDKMRHVYHNADEAKAKGEKAFLRARNFTWKAMGTALTKLLIEKNIIKL